MKMILLDVVVAKAFVEDEETSVDETIEEIPSLTDSPPVDEADPEDVTSLDDGLPMKK